MSSRRSRRLTPEEDAQRYRDGYPDQEDPPDAWDNVRFYKGEIESRSMDGRYPDTEKFIDEMHGEWYGNYEKLDHGSYEWLFPVREQGANRDSQKLTAAERDEMIDDPECMDRLLRSYEMALDFYGFVLVNTETGELERTENWEERFANLNEKTHNFLRITRILKFLGEFGFTGYQAPLVRALMAGVYEPPHSLWAVKKSLLDYFVPVVKDDMERTALMAEIIDLDRTTKPPLREPSRGTRRSRERGRNEVEDDRPRQRPRPSEAAPSTAKSIPPWKQNPRQPPRPSSKYEEEEEEY